MGSEDTSAMVENGSFRIEIEEFYDRIDFAGTSNNSPGYGSCIDYHDGKATVNFSQNTLLFNEKFLEMNRLETSAALKKIKTGEYMMYLDTYGKAYKRTYIVLDLKKGDSVIGSFYYYGVLECMFRGKITQ